MPYLKTFRERADEPFLPAEPEEAPVAEKQTPKPAVDATEPLETKSVSEQAAPLKTTPTPTYDSSDLEKALAALDSKALVRQSVEQGALEAQKAVEAAVRADVDISPEEVLDYLGGRARKPEVVQLLSKPVMDPTAARAPKGKTGEFDADAQVKTVRPYADVVVDVFDAALKGQYVKQATEGLEDETARKEAAAAAKAKYRADMEKFREGLVRDGETLSLRRTKEHLATMYSGSLAPNANINVLEVAAREGAGDAVQLFQKGLLERFASSPVDVVRRAFETSLYEDEAERGVRRREEAQGLASTTYERLVKRSLFDPTVKPDLGDRVNLILGAGRVRQSAPVEATSMSADALRVGEMLNIPAPAIQGIMTAESAGRPTARAFNLHRMIGDAAMTDEQREQTYAALARAGFDAEKARAEVEAGDPVPFTMGEGERAIEAVFDINPQAALRASAWGKFQVMGKEGNLIGLMQQIVKEQTKRELDDDAAARAAYNIFRTGQGANELSDALLINWFRQSPKAYKIIQQEMTPERIRTLSGLYHGTHPASSGHRQGWEDNFAKGYAAYSGTDLTQGEPGESQRDFGPSEAALREQEVRDEESGIIGGGTRAENLFGLVADVALPGSAKQTYTQEETAAAKGMNFVQVASDAFGSNDRLYLPEPGTEKNLVAVAALKEWQNETGLDIQNYATLGMGRGFSRLQQEVRSNALQSAKREADRQGLTGDAREKYLEEAQAEAARRATLAATSAQTAGLWLNPIVTSMREATGIGGETLFDGAPEFMRSYAEALAPKIELLGRNGDELIYRQEGGGQALLSTLDAAPGVGQAFNVGVINNYIVPNLESLGLDREEAQAVSPFVATAMAMASPVVQPLLTLGGQADDIYYAGVAGVGDREELVQYGMETLSAQAGVTAELASPLLDWMDEKDYLSWAAPTNVTGSEERVVAVKDTIRSSGAIAGMGVGLLAAVLHPDLLGGAASGARGVSAAGRALRATGVTDSLRDAVHGMRFDIWGKAVDRQAATLELFGRNDVAADFVSDADTVQTMLDETREAVVASLRSADEYDEGFRVGHEAAAKEVDQNQAAMLGRMAADGNVGAQAALDAAVSRRVASVIEASIEAAKSGDDPVRAAKAAELEEVIKSSGMAGRLDLLILSPSMTDVASKTSQTAGVAFGSADRADILLRALEIVDDVELTMEPRLQLLAKNMSGTPVESFNGKPITAFGATEGRVVTVSASGKSDLLSLFGLVEPEAFEGSLKNVRKQGSKSADEVRGEMRAQYDAVREFIEDFRATVTSDEVLDEETMGLFVARALEIGLSDTNYRMLRNSTPNTGGKNLQKVVQTVLNEAKSAREASSVTQVLQTGLAAVGVSSLTRAEALKDLARSRVGQMPPEAIDSFLDTQGKGARTQRVMAAVKAGTVEGVTTLLQGTPFFGKLFGGEVGTYQARMARRHVAQADGSDPDSVAHALQRETAGRLRARLVAMTEDLEDEALDTVLRSETYGVLKEQLARVEAPEWRAGFVSWLHRASEQRRGGQEVEVFEDLPVGIDMGVFQKFGRRSRASKATRKFLERTNFFDAFGFAGEQEQRTRAFSQKTRTRKKKINRKEQRTLALLIDQMAKGAAGVTDEMRPAEVEQRLTAFYDNVLNVQRTVSTKKYQSALEEAALSVETEYQRRLTEALRDVVEPVAADTPTGSLVTEVDAGGSLAGSWYTLDSMAGTEARLRPAGVVGGARPARVTKPLEGLRVLPEEQYDNLRQAAAQARFDAIEAVVDVVDEDTGRALREMAEVDGGLGGDALLQSEDDSRVLYQKKGGALADFEVGEVSHVEARRLVERLHYTGTLANTSTHRTALMLDGRPVGVAVWTQAPTPAVKQWAARQFEGVDPNEVVYLHRLVMVPGLPKNATSRLLGQSLRELRQRGDYKVAVTYADTGQGHHGGIYQATNWIYTGSSPGRKVWVDAEGRPVPTKSGNTNRTNAEMRALGYRQVRGAEKHRYVYAIDKRAKYTPEPEDYPKPDMPDDAALAAPARSDDNDTTRVVVGARRVGDPLSPASPDVFYQKKASPGDPLDRVEPRVALSERGGGDPLGRARGHTLDTAIEAGEYREARATYEGQDLADLAAEVSRRGIDVPAAESDKDALVSALLRDDFGGSVPRPADVGTTGALASAEATRLEGLRRLLVEPALPRTSPKSPDAPRGAEAPPRPPEQPPGPTPGATPVEVEEDAKGMVRFVDDARAIITAFKSADASTGLHELSHVARRQLGDAQQQVILDWVNSALAKKNKAPVTIRVTESGARLYTSADKASVVAAEEMFARGFERYLREGVVPTSSLRSAFRTMKKVLSRIYVTVFGSDIDVDISPEMYNLFDEMFGAKRQVTLDDVTDTARFLDAQAELRRAGEAAREGREGAPRSRYTGADRTVESGVNERTFIDSVRQWRASVEDYHSRGVGFLAPDRGTSVKAAAEAGRTVGPGSRGTSRIDQTAIGPVSRRRMSPEEIVAARRGDTKALAKFKRLSVADKIVVGAAWAATTWTRLTLFGDDHARAFRAINPTLRTMLRGAEREFEEMTSELSLLIRDVAMTSGPARAAAESRVISYLCGPDGFLENRPLLVTGARRGQKARQNFVNTSRALSDLLDDFFGMMSEGSLDALTNDAEFVLHTLAGVDAGGVRSGERGALDAFWRGLTVAPEGKKTEAVVDGGLVVSDEVVEKLAVGADGKVSKANLSELQTDLLKSIYTALTGEPEALVGKVDAGARNLAALMAFVTGNAGVTKDGVRLTIDDLVASDGRVMDHSTRLLHFLYYGGELRREGVTAVVPGIRTGAADDILESQQFSTLLAMGTAGYAAGVLKDYALLGRAVSPRDMRAYNLYQSGRADMLSPAEIERAIEIADQYGFTKFALSPLATGGVYIPSDVRAGMVKQLQQAQRQMGQTAAKVSATEEFLRRSAGWILSGIIFGTAIGRQAFKLMSTQDLGYQLGLVAGGSAGVAASARASALTLLTAVGGERAAELTEEVVRRAAKAAPGEAVDDFVKNVAGGDAESFKMALRRASVTKMDDIVNAATEFLGTSKFRVEVAPIMDNQDAVFVLGGSAYNARDLRREFTRAGLYSNAYKEVRFLLTRDFSRQGEAATVREMRQEDVERMLSENGASAANIGFFRSMIETPGDASASAWRAAKRGGSTVFEYGLESADAWSDLERTGGAVTLIEQGMRPYDAAKVMVEAVYDYRGSMGEGDRAWWRKLLMPFWAFRKNANIQFANLAADPATAFRLMALSRATRWAPQALTYALYETFLEPYDVNVDGMSGSQRDLYYNLRAHLEYGYSDEVTPEVLESYRGLLPEEQRDMSDSDLLDHDFDGWTIREGFKGYPGVPQEMKLVMRALIAGRGNALTRKDGGIYDLRTTIVNRNARDRFVQMGQDVYVQQGPHQGGLPSWAAKRPNVQFPVPVLDEYAQQVHAMTRLNEAGRENVAGLSFYFVLPDNFIMAASDMAAASIIAPVAIAAAFDPDSSVDKTMVLNALEALVDVRGFGSPLGQVGMELAKATANEDAAKMGRVRLHPLMARALEGSIGVPVPAEGGTENRSGTSFFHKSLMRMAQVGAHAGAMGATAGAEVFAGEDTGSMRTFSRPRDFSVEVDPETGERAVAPKDRPLSQEYVNKRDEMYAYQPYLYGPAAALFPNTEAGRINSWLLANFDDSSPEAALKSGESFRNFLLAMVIETARQAGTRVMAEDPELTAIIDKPRK